MGTFADYLTREARRLAHNHFDNLWEHNHMTRVSAYKWLAGVLDIEEEDCRIAMFNKETCFQVVDEVLKFRRGIT